MTVMARHVIAEPVRSASETWNVIVDLLAPEPDHKARNELLGVIGVASSLIAAEAMRDAPLVVYGAGPRVRIYCLYGESAILGEEANESSLTVSAVNGDWAMSLPCPSEDLEWVQAALKKRSTRITARELNTSVDDNRLNVVGKSADLNVEAFLRS